MTNENGMLALRRITLTTLILLTLVGTAEAQRKSRRASANEVPILTTDLPKHAVKILGQSRYKCSGTIAFLDEDRIVSFERNGASIIDIETGETKKVFEVGPRKLLDFKSYGNRWMVATSRERPGFQIELFDVQNPGKTIKHQLEGTVSDVFEDGSVLLVSAIDSLQLVGTSDGKVIASWPYQDGIRQVTSLQLTNNDSAIAISYLMEEGYETNPQQQFAFLELDKTEALFGDIVSTVTTPKKDHFQLKTVNTGPFAFFVGGRGDFIAYNFLTEDRREFKSPGVSVLSIDIDKYTGRLITAGVSGFIDTWDPTTQSSLLSFRTRFKGSGNACFAQSGKMFATNVGGRLRVWHSERGNLLYGPGVEELSALDAIAISANDDAVAVADMTGHVEVWDVKKGKRVRMAYGEIQKGKRQDTWISPNFLSFSNNGKLLLGGSDQAANVVNVWESNTGASVSRIPGHRWPIMAVAWSPNNRLIASTSRDGLVQVVNDSGQVVGKLRGSMVSAFLPDGKHVVSAKENDSRIVEIYNLESGALAATLVPPGEVEIMFHGLAVSPKGNLIAAAYQRGDLVVWDDSGKVVYSKKMEDHYKASTGAVSFSSDGSTLAFSAGGREVWLLDAATGKEKLRLRESDNVLGLAFGKSLLATVSNHHATLWDPEF